MPRRTRPIESDEMAQTIIKKSFDMNFKVVDQFELKDVHKSFEALAFSRDTRVVFVDGPAGSAKTYCAARVGLHLLRARAADEMVYIRSIIESASKSMGSLPGEVEDKFSPWVIPLKEKLDELLKPGISQELLDHNIVRAIPVNYVRGLTFNDAVVIVDEAQNLTRSELITIMTRLGEGSKMLIVGDTQQSDINGKSGFKQIYNLFNDQSSEEAGMFCFKFEHCDIVRSEIVKFIISKLDSLDE